MPYKDPEKRREYMKNYVRTRKPKSLGCFEDYIHNSFHYKKAFAKRNSIPFDLDEEYLKTIWTEDCPVFGVPLSWEGTTGSLNKAQLDRTIPEIGYVKGNVVWLSSRANRLKSDATLGELEMLVDYLSGLKSGKPVSPKDPKPVRVSEAVRPHFLKVCYDTD